MGASGMQCEIRTRGLGDENIDKRLNFFLIENYETAVVMLDSMDADTKEKLLTALDKTEEEIKQGPFMVSSSLAQAGPAEKAAIDEVIRSFN